MLIPWRLIIFQGLGKQWWERRFLSNLKMVCFSLQSSWLERAAILGARRDWVPDKSLVYPPRSNGLKG